MEFDKEVKDISGKRNIIKTFENELFLPPRVVAVLVLDLFHNPENP